MAGSAVTSSAVATEMNLSQVFVRSKLEDKVQGSLLKKRKLEEKLHRKEERRNAKKIFKGFSQETEETSILPEIKFSKAVPINGVKRVLKSTGDLVRLYWLKKIDSSLLCNTNRLIVMYTLGQGSQTRGLRAACGPPDVFVRPASSLKVLILWLKV